MLQYGLIVDRWSGADVVYLGPSWTAIGAADRARGNCAHSCVGASPCALLSRENQGLDRRRARGMPSRKPWCSADRTGL